MAYRTGPTGKFHLLEPLAPPIGVLADLVAEPTAHVALDPGGIFVVMSDGIFESRSESGDLFEVDRVLHLLESCQALPPEQILTAVKDAMRQWQGREEPIDDQTMVILQRDA